MARFGAPRRHGRRLVRSAHNLFAGNRFRSGNAPWVVCGDLHNASRFAEACRTAPALVPALAPALAP